MKISLTGDYFGLIIGNTFYLVGPFASSLDGGLHCLRSGVHRQGDILAGQLTDSLQKRSQLVGMKSARNNIQISGLTDERLDQSRVCVSVADGRIGAHHVHVPAPGVIPDVWPVPPNQHDRQRVVIVGAEFVFSFDRRVCHFRLGVACRAHTIVPHFRPQNSSRMWRGELTLAPNGACGYRRIPVSGTGRGAGYEFTNRSEVPQAWKA